MARRSRFSCDDVDQTINSRPPIASLRIDATPDIYASAEIPTPAERRLNVYAFDPSQGHYVGNFMAASVRYEKLEAGPVGDRFAVIDYDGSQKTFYKPVDLNDPRLLAQGGLAPNEADPRFHQQMVYAVASETLQRFDMRSGARCIGRRRSRTPARLNLFPHAMCEANAFDSLAAHGVLFGYFEASTVCQPGSIYRARRYSPAFRMISSCMTLMQLLMASGPTSQKRLTWMWRLFTRPSPIVRAIGYILRTRMSS